MTKDGGYWVLLAVLVVTAVWYWAVPEIEREGFYWIWFAVLFSALGLMAGGRNGAERRR